MRLPAADISAYANDKAAALGSLTGTALEIGAGTGANLGCFALEINWVALEPHPGWRRELARAGAAQGHETPIIDAPAKRLPLDDARVDTMASTATASEPIDIEQLHGMVEL